MVSCCWKNLRVDIDSSLPWICGCQRHRSNIPADTPTANYCHNICIPLLDHLLSEFDSHLGCHHQQTALQGLSLVPSILITLPEEESSTKVSQLADKQDIPSPDNIQVNFTAGNWSGNSNLVSMGVPAYVSSSPSFTLSICHFKRTWSVFSVPYL